MLVWARGDMDRDGRICGSEGGEMMSEEETIRRMVSKRIGIERSWGKCCSYFMPLELPAQSQ